MRIVEPSPPEVRAYVPRCARRINAHVYHRAMLCKTVYDAYKCLRVIEHELPIPLVRPWESDPKVSKGFIERVGDYHPDYPNDIRNAERIGRIVPEFSSSSVKPKRRRGRKRIPHAPKSYIGRVLDDGTYEYGPDNQPKDEPVTECMRVPISR